MNIYILVPVFNSHDAVGNDVELMKKILNKYHNCYVYAENQINKSVEYISENDLYEGIAHKNAVIIYHHATSWQRGYEILKKAKCKIIFRYHNITLPEFFKDYSMDLSILCEKGRAQTEQLAREFPNSFWICDSKYNAEDLIGVPKESIGISAPFHKTLEWTKTEPDKKILEELKKSNCINLLFVGRIVPNKGHLFLFDVLKTFIKNYDKNIKLRIIGKIDINGELGGYYKLLLEIIKKYKLKEYVEFVQEVNDNSLMAYYLGSDFYICASEHEGFCVPIIESQFLKLPIIALNESAVPETIGKNQVLLNKDAKKFAGAIKILSEHKEYKNYLVNSGVKNFNERFSMEVLEKHFLEVFEKALR